MKSDVSWVSSCIVSRALGEGVTLWLTENRDICHDVTSWQTDEVKPGFHYPSWRPKFTGRVDGCQKCTRMHSSLKYDGHINRIVAKAYSRIGILFRGFFNRNMVFLRKDTLFTLDLYSNTRPAFGLHISQYGLILVMDLGSIFRYFPKLQDIAFFNIFRRWWRFELHECYLISVSTTSSPCHYR